jgi:hypothetical protein
MTSPGLTVMLVIWTRGFGYRASCN